MSQTYFECRFAPQRTDFPVCLYAQVGKSLDLAKFAVASAIENAGMKFREDFEICFLCWRTSDEVYEWLDENKYWHVDLPCEDFKEIGFVEMLYRGWNTGLDICFEHSNYCVPIATDHYFFPEWLINLVKWGHPYKIISCTLIEPGPQTLHPACDLGQTLPGYFNHSLARDCYDQLYQDELVQDKYSGYYHLDYGVDSQGNVRQDAMPYIMSRKTWEKFGPMVPFNEYMTTGDSDLFDRIRHDKDFGCYRSGGSLSFHTGGAETKRNA